jgi:hypothetical protein
MRYHPTRNSAAWHLLAQVGTWHTALSGRDTARGETRARPGCYARPEQRFRPMRYHPTRIFSARCFGNRGCGQLDRTMLIEVSMAGEPSALGDRRCGPLYGSSGTADSLSANVAVRRQLRPWLRCTNIRTAGGATTTPGSTLAQVRRLCGGRQARILRVGLQLRPWLRCINIRTTAEATTTLASTVTQAALRRFGNRECQLCGTTGGSPLRAWPASTLAQVRRLCGDRQARTLRVSGATMLWFDRVVA